MPDTTQEQALNERQKFVNAFNATMIQIWQEQITLLDVIDTGALLRSPISLPVQADGRFLEITLSQSFLEYGIWQDYGTGKEVYRGNPGDIYPDQEDRKKIRVSKRWFSIKYYSSVMNLKDFMADSIGKEFVGVVTNALNKQFGKQNKASLAHRKYSDL